VSLYVALVPQLSRCQPSIYKRLKENLIDRPMNLFSKTPDILDDLQEAFNCFGFTCEDFGYSADVFNSKCGSQIEDACWRDISDIKCEYGKCCVVIAAELLK
jgi:hypothetical protein